MCKTINRIKTENVDAELLKKDAKENKYSVQHAFLLKRYKSGEKKN